MNTESIELIASKLGVAVDKLLPILITQAHIYSLSYALGGLLLISLSAIIFFKRELVWNYVTKNDLEPIVLIFGVLWLFFVIGGIVNFNNFITSIVNPEYWAISELLSQIH